MPFKPVLTSAVAALAAALLLTGCSISTTAPTSEPSASSSSSSEPAETVAVESFVADGLYEIAFAEKSFATADGGETAPASAQGWIQFKGGECAADIAGKDVMGNEIRIVKALGENGYVWDSVSRSWTEMGSPYIPSLVSATPGVIAFNRAAGNTFSFCALAAFNEMFESSPENPALYVSSSTASTEWVAANVKKYAEKLASAAMLEGADKDAAIAKIVAANTFGNLPETRIYAYDLAGLVTIEDATETSAFTIEMIRQDDKAAVDFKPALPKDASVTRIGDLALGYIQSLN